MEQFFHFKREPDAETLWNELRKTFEQGVAWSKFLESLPGTKQPTVNPDWVKKYEDQLLAEAEKGY